MHRFTVLQVGGIREHCNAWEITFLFVVAKEEEHFVFDDWATDSAAKLKAHVLRA